MEAYTDRQFDVRFCLVFAFLPRLGFTTGLITLLRRADGYDLAREIISICQIIWQRYITLKSYS